MPRFEIDVEPCDHITADAIGKPGQRVFYLQAYQEQRTITVIIEKAQLQSMAIGFEQFLSQVAEQNPELDEASGDYVEDIMHINPPVDPLFRVGEIGLGYDKDRDRVVVFTKELLTEEEDPESAAVVRFWAWRTQVRMLARWGVEVVSRGRPMCPQCGLRVDGGASANDILCRFQADILGIPVLRPKTVETTGLGAAYLRRPRRRGLGVDGGDQAPGRRRAQGHPGHDPGAGRQALRRMAGGGS